MRIGVDARSLSEPITGIGRYTLSLLELMVLDNSNEWLLYSHRPLLHGQWNMQNVTVRTLFFPKWMRGLYFPWSQLILPFWVKHDNIDLFWSPAHRLPRQLSKSVASVVTIHDLVWKRAPETMKPIGRLLDAKLMPHAIRVADQVIAVSESTKRDVISEVPEAKDKVQVIYEANSLLSNDCINSIKTDENYILFVGTLEPRKNLSRLIEAYAMLSESLRSKYSLMIVGGKGWGDENLDEIIDYFKIRKYVKILGYVSNKKLVHLYSNAYLFVMPSLYEGFGLPVLEAMSLGVPVVASNTSSLPEVVSDTAILVSPKSVSSIKNGIEKLLSNNKLRQKLSKAALERSMFFSWEKASKENIKVFEKAVFSHSKNSI